MVEDEAYGLRIFSGFGGGGVRFLPDLGEEVYGFFWGRRRTDCLRFFTGFGGGGRIVDFWDLVEEAYELFTVFYFWGKRLADCLWISIGFGGEGLRIVCGFLPDVEDEACGLFTDVYRM